MILLQGGETQVLPTMRKHNSFRNGKGNPGKIRSSPSPSAAFCNSNMLRVALMAYLSLFVIKMTWDIFIRDDMGQYAVAPQASYEGMAMPSFDGGVHIVHTR